ncbi:EAL domain-containing protein [Vibrio hepatarius]|uniref:EAL domain-containing protein n=1 Tax=Vibrio hepatarius TaxID=171383 RepID=UPI003735DFE8
MLLIVVENKAYEVDVAFQPICDLGNNQPVYYEALARFKDIESGRLVNTGWVIDSLINMNIINDFTLKFFEYTFNTMKSHNLNFRCSFNLESTQLINPNFIASLITLIKGFNVGETMIEITERTSVPDSLNKNKMEGLYTLKDADLAIALDDFGMDNSNLIDLFQFRYDVVKLAKSLVDVTLEDDHAMRIIKQLALESQKKGIQIIAEGIEDRAACERIKKMNISLVQGYAFGKPMTISSSMYCQRVS